jgi:hypothetical protein
MSMSDIQIGRTTRWVGFLYFAGVMVMLAGLLEMTQGLVALLRTDYYTVSSDGLLIAMDYTAWGWLHLGIAAILMVTGVGLFVGKMWSRVLGIVIATLSILVNIAFFPAYPIWGVLVIGMSVLVIYALIVHGREPSYV